MSGSDYTHFTKLAFDELFARKSAGSEVLIMDSDGNFTPATVAPSSGGTAAAPAFHPSTDANTGIYFGAADTINFSANGVSRAEITSASLTVRSTKILLPDGSLTGASLGFENDAGETGIYRSAADELSFASNGVQAAKLSSTGVFTALVQLVGKGTSTNNSAATGFIGEYLISTVALRDITAATGVYEDLASLSLTAGDWDITGGLHFVLNSATVTQCNAALSLFSGNTTTDHASGYNNFNAQPPTATSPTTQALPPFRVSVSATTTVYLKARNAFSAGTPKIGGTIRARRVR